VRNQWRIIPKIAGIRGHLLTNAERFAGCRVMENQIWKSGTELPDSGRMPSKNQPCGDQVSNPPKKETEKLSRFTRIPHKALHQDGTTCETQ
jgi:hypothetical protein